MHVIRHFALTVAMLLAVAAIARGEVNQLSAEELSDGWILLFDGESLFGWTPASKADWQVVDGAIRVSEGEKGLLCTTSEFGNYAFKCDFRCPATTNSGIFLRTPLQPTDPAKDCYELNIAAPEVSPFSTGSFVNRQKSTIAPVDASAWRTFEVTADGGHFTVKIDGETALEYTDAAPIPRGRIGLQLNSGEVEFRNVKLKPLGLEPIFNGRELTGWKPYPGRASVFSVTPAGELNVKNGSGALESEAQFADFTLQLEVFSNGEHLNSGIFFRSIPGEYTQGYEAQIHNGYLEGDRTKPTDFGTGGFYRRQSARKVVADDFTWFHQTLIVSGDHMASWVNGYQVSDWTDTRPPNDNPRQGLRRAAGTLMIQGHDPTTDLSFRNLRAAEMPAAPDAAKE